MLHVLHDLIIIKINFSKCITRHPVTPVQFVFLQPLNSIFTEILQLKTLKGLALHDILTEVHLLIHRGKATADGKPGIMFSNSQQLLDLWLVYTCRLTLTALALADMCW